MILISHRGNINGAHPNLENSPQYINEALKNGYECEIDVWLYNNKLFLGHDNPIYFINLEFLSDKCQHLWCHAKNIEALFFLLENNFHCFWHQEDDVTITSKGFIWTHTLKSEAKYLEQKHSIAVMPEWNNDKLYVDHCVGICSDYIRKYTKYA